MKRMSAFTYLSLDLFGATSTLKARITYLYEDQVDIWPSADRVDIVRVEVEDPDSGVWQVLPTPIALAITQDVWVRAPLARYAADEDLLLVA